MMSHEKEDTLCKIDKVLHIKQSIKFKHNLIKVTTETVVNRSLAYFYPGEYSDHVHPCCYIIASMISQSTSAISAYQYQLPSTQQLVIMLSS